MKTEIWVIFSEFFGEKIPWDIECALWFQWTWWRHQMETFSSLLAICAGNSPVAGESPPWCGAFQMMFPLMCVWINGWVNNGEAGDLRRYRAHYDVTVMTYSGSGVPWATQVSGIDRPGVGLYGFSFWGADCIKMGGWRAGKKWLSNISAVLIHWGRGTHIHECVSKLTSIGSDNGLSPGRRQAIIWTYGGILLIGPLGTYFSEILIEIYTFPFKKIHLNMSSGKWRLICLGPNVLSFGLMPNTSDMAMYGSGHEGAPVLLPGFAIKW